MDYELHHVSGFFGRRIDAQQVLQTLIDEGLSHTQLRVYPDTAALGGTVDATASDRTLRNILVDGAIGTAVGTGVGALAEAALVAANISLFVASPLLAPLLLLGWGAGLGATVGAVVGAEKKDRSLAALIEDAVQSGQFVLIARTHNAKETTIAQQVMHAALASRQTTQVV